MSPSKEFSVLSRNSFKNGNTVYGASSTPAGGSPDVFSSGVNFFFYPQSIKREGVADMNVTWSDLIQFCMLIVAVLAYAENKKK